MTKILEVCNVSKKYNTIDGEIKALEDITFSVDEGEFVAIVGMSGCGKSTLLSILAGLEDKTSGDIKYMKDNIVTGYMLQDDDLLSEIYEDWLKFDAPLVDSMRDSIDETITRKMNNALNER